MALPKYVDGMMHLHLDVLLLLTSEQKNRSVSGGFKSTSWALHLIINGLNVRLVCREYSSYGHNADFSDFKSMPRCFDTD